MRYIYGPVQSRRLGWSLGVNPVLTKVCNFDCVYCQLKRTTVLTRERKKYVPEEEILEELKGFFKNKPKDLKVDCITFSGSGEPTLHKSIGRLVRAVKALTHLSVALMTNSSTLADPCVRRDLQDVDIIVPSLDAVTQGVFEKIDRPVQGIKVQDIIRGLISFRRTFRGQIWLEIMVVKGINDSPEYFKKMKKIVDKINPDRIQLNSPVRIPAEGWVRPASQATLAKARKIFGNNCDIV